MDGLQFSPIIVQDPDTCETECPYRDISFTPWFVDFIDVTLAVEDTTWIVHKSVNNALVTNLSSLLHRNEGKNRFISIDIVLFIIFLLGQGCNDCFCSLMDTSSSWEEYNQEYKNLNKSLSTMPERDAPH